jgi:hypothetical protein
LLEQHSDTPYRVAAYRRAADTVESLPRDLAGVFQTEGIEGLTALPTVGTRIGAAIAEMLRTGHWTLLEKMRGSVDPHALFEGVPGIGPKLAHVVMDTLHIDDLESLEIAAHDGRLAKTPGFGPRRVAMVRAALAQMLGRRGDRPLEPDVDVLLDVDREYREKAAAGALRRIAPRRFNPKNEAWLPILHTARGTWEFDVLYSNTGLAHNLGRTHDWVIVHFSHDRAEGQRTVVTETRGPLEGQRVVRGREQECLERKRQPEQLFLGVA